MKYIILLLFVLWARNLDSQVYKIESENLIFAYLGENLSYVAPYGLKTFANANDFHKKIWDWTPSEDVIIFLNDMTDEGNGGTIVMPRNYVILYIAPFAHDFDVVPTNERLQWLMNHELAHVFANDKAAFEEKFWRSVFFGKVAPKSENPLSMIYGYLTTPRWYSPRWYQEGIAVFMETWMSGGLGRSIGGYDETVFRTMTLDSSYFYKLIGLETEGTSIDFQVGVNSYLYGTRFIGYIAYKYGVEKLMKWYSRDDSSAKFYAAQFEKVFGLPIDDAWTNWIDFERDFQKKNIDRIDQYETTNLRYVTEKPLGSVSKAYFDKASGNIFCAVNHPGKLSRIVTIDSHSGKIKEIDEVLSPKLRNVTHLAADFDSGVLLTSTNNKTWRDLKSINLKTGEEKILQKRCRVGHFALNPMDKSLWGVQTISGRTAIVRAKPPYEKFERVHSIRFGDSFFSLDVSPDGKYLTGTRSDPSGRQKLVCYEIDELINGNSDFREIYEFEDNSTADFRFSENGEYLYGTSYYTGVSNVFQIEFETGEMKALSNVERGLFRPLDVGGDSLLVWEYTTGGLRPALIQKRPIEDVNAIEYLGQKIIENNPELKKWRLPSPKEIDIDSSLKTEKAYNSFENISLASVYPIVEGYKEFPSYGLKFNFSDRLGVNALDVTASYSPNPLLPEKQRTHILLDYKFWTFKFKAAWNKADFYDLFGPTKTSRAGYSAQASYIEYLMPLSNPETLNLTLSAGVFGDLEYLPSYQNVGARLDRLYQGEVELHYSLLRKSLGAIENEAGVEAKLTLDANYAAEKASPRLMASCDWGVLGSTKNSSIWLRAAAGAGFGERGNPLSKFYFGGFGNNYVDKKPSRQYRLPESFPGLEINEVPALNFGKLTAEYNFSPLRFKNIGLLYLFPTHANLSVFGSALAADFDFEESRRYVYNCGVQADFEIVFFSLLETTFSIGYGTAFEKGEHRKDGFLISLKLL